MTVTQLAKIIDGTLLCADGSRTASCCMSCDLLSLAMAGGKADMAWITVQKHMNVIAVAALHEMSCIILPLDITMEQEQLDKAAQEGIAVIRSPLSAYEICGRLYAAGLR